MKRRPFLKTAAIGATAIFATPHVAANPALGGKKNRTIKPKRLRPGDGITLIAPGGPVNDEKIALAIKNIEDLGLKPKLSRNLRAKRGYMAGTDTQRLHDFHNAFADTETKAIWCVRGGDGCNRLLPSIDYDLIKENPKALIGFSDITALINAIYRKTGLVGLHGPIAAWDFTDFNTKHLKAVLFHGGAGHTVYGTEKTETLVNGKVTGKLMGGNLSLLSALSGTGFDNDFKDKIVFIEDVGEKPRKVDRMLTQLRQANGLERAKGIILGEFDDCEPGEGEDSLSLIEALKDRLSGLNIPMVYNFPFGHDKNLCTFPVGIQVALDASNKSITFREDTTL
ncbi:S66 peptidase family protein [Maribacter polysaccharolyticus]|uniref:S66 peptidase family protein n=1 Tax=Maribacter polysaccharolyticus TaxID=3020831 RepID=UPI00237F46F1|nr:LD-carboxypeptidase [Maribacter polysaccharolyticus]MDE3741988.1 LD-carboxypeptidase [Maribacter polysaccharolyticus]